jgi:hypothetical protein
MKRIAVLLVALSVLLACSAALAEEAQPAGTPADPGTAAPANPPAGDQPKITTLPYDRKSPFLSGGLSLLFPGAGQMYNGQYLLGAFWLVAEAGLYTGFFAYATGFKAGARFDMGFESIFLLIVASSLHFFSIYDAVTESVRINDDLDKFSVAYDPVDRGVRVAYRWRF